MPGDRLLTGVTRLRGKNPEVSSSFIGYPVGDAVFQVSLREKIALEDRAYSPAAQAIGAPQLKNTSPFGIRDNSESHRSNIESAAFWGPAEELSSANWTFFESWIYMSYSQRSTELWYMWDSILNAGSPGRWCFDGEEREGRLPCMFLRSKREIGISFDSYKNKL